MTKDAPTPRVSILFGTCNRRALLQQCIEKCRASIPPYSHEFVICDGGSDDGSREWLVRQDDVVLIADTGCYGAVDAFNRCAKLARGDFFITLNDDCYPVGDALKRAIDVLVTEPDVGQVAMGVGQHTEARGIINALSATNHVYANFGAIRRSIVEVVTQITGGMWNPRYHTYAADTELSAWVYRLGHNIRALPEAVIRDLLLDDKLRQANHKDDRARDDGHHFWRRWTFDIHRVLMPRGPYPPVSDEEIVNLKKVEGVK